MTPRGVYERTEYHSQRMIRGVRNAGGRAGPNNQNWRGGKVTHPLYWIYNDMISRCRNETHKRYRDYGGRGITVCDEWAVDFWMFVRDVGDRPEGTAPSGRALYTIDRIDNEQGYKPGNVRWVTQKVQNQNKRLRTVKTYEHGTVSRYRQRDCRCDSCVTAMRMQWNKWDLEAKERNVR